MVSSQNNPLSLMFLQDLSALNLVGCALVDDVMLRDVEEIDPADRGAFDAHWKKILGEETIVKRTILFDGHVVGSVASFIDQEFGKREVTYWIGREYWGKGIATKALSKFLRRTEGEPHLCTGFKR